MTILNTIKKTTESITNSHGISCEVTVTDSFIELVTKTKKDAFRLKKAFNKVFGNVDDILDLSEIGEEGFILTVRF